MIVVNLDDVLVTLMPISGLQMCDDPQICDGDDVTTVTNVAPVLMF